MDIFDSTHKIISIIFACTHTNTHTLTNTQLVHSHTLKAKQPILVLFLQSSLLESFIFKSYIYQCQLYFGTPATQLDSYMHKKNYSTESNKTHNKEKMTNHVNVGDEPNMFSIA